MSCIYSINSKFEFKLYLSVDTRDWKIGKAVNGIESDYKKKSIKGIFTNYKWIKIII